LQIVNDWRVNLESLWTPLFTSAVRIQRYAAFNLVPFNTDSYSQTVDVPGAQGVITAPALVAGIITWRTGLRGRRYRGRTYVGGVGNSDIVNGRLAPSVVTGRWKAFGDAIMARWGAGGTNLDMRFGVWSRVLGNQKPPHDKAGLTTISSYTIQDRLGSMGTRRVGRGI
jgi:hypothetical protein